VFTYKQLHDFDKAPEGLFNVTFPDVQERRGQISHACTQRANARGEIKLFFTFLRLEMPTATCGKAASCLIATYLERIPCQSRT
jgi:hypothetical protein